MTRLPGKTNAKHFTLVFPGNLVTPVSIDVQAFEHELHVAMRDEGPGLSTEQQQKIWERFSHAPGVKVQSKSTGGLGVGLAICRMLVEQCSGQVGVQSQEGHGATFWFTLPLIPEKDMRQLTMMCEAIDKIFLSLRGYR